MLKKIIEIIEQNCPVIRDGDTDLAAKEILKHLDNLLDLEGNRWFDNDEEMINFLERE